jgi:hypothetical protein
MAVFVLCSFLFVLFSNLDSMFSEFGDRLRKALNKVHQE